MMNKHKSFVLPTAIILLLITLFSGCKGIQWGGDLSKINNDITTSCFFYRDETQDSPLIKKDFLIGNTYKIPEFTREEISSLQNPGYVPKAWKLKNSALQDSNIILDSNGFVVSFKVGYKPYEFVSADWGEASDTLYRVLHYKEKLDRSYELAETTDCYGTTGMQTNARDYINTYTGFTADLPITEKPIAADGSTVVNIYYNRNIYNVTFYNEDGTTVIDDSQYKYDEPLKVPTVDPKDGKQFLGWALKGDTTAIIILPSTVTSSFEFVAVYSIIYTVEFILDGGTTTTGFNETTDDGNGHITSGKFFGIAGETLPAVATPVKANMQFQYWIDISDNSQAEIPATFQKNASYKAYYELVTQTVGGFTVTFATPEADISDAAANSVSRTSISGGYRFSVPSGYSQYIWFINATQNGTTDSYYDCNLATMSSGRYEIMAVCYDAAGKAVVYTTKFTVSSNVGL